MLHRPALLLTAEPPSVWLSSALLALCCSPASIPACLSLDVLQSDLLPEEVVAVARAARLVDGIAETPESAASSMQRAFPTSFHASRLAALQDLAV